jgi:cytochrome c
VTLFAAVVAISFLSLGALAKAEGPAEGGKIIAQERCANCHAIGPEGESPREEAPPFRQLHYRYPVEHLAEALAEGIDVGHEAMPEFVLEPREIDALIAYLKTLEPAE